ncbi:hypothetical protein DFH09DRAFT_1324730 [Mycena vulgaris]|nr:hypothetical protein DFH09DRAFT_1324730 [Mycena vulgaris]
MAPISRLLLAGLAFALVSLAAGSRRRAVFKPLTPYVQTLHARRPSVIGGLLQPHLKGSVHRPTSPVGAQHPEAQRVL